MVASYDQIPLRKAYGREEAATACYLINQTLRGSLCTGILLLIQTNIPRRV